MPLGPSPSPPIVSIPVCSEGGAGNQSPTWARTYQRFPIMWSLIKRHQLASCGILRSEMSAVPVRGAHNTPTHAEGGGKDSPRSSSCARTAPVCKMARFVRWDAPLLGGTTHTQRTRGAPPHAITAAYRAPRHFRPGGANCGVASVFLSRSFLEPR